MVSSTTRFSCSFYRGKPDTKRAHIALGALLCLN